MAIFSIRAAKGFSDTHPDAEQVQLRLLREATVARRVGLLRSLTQLAVSNSKRAIQRANPKLSQCEQDVLFVELNYGKDLADRVRARLDQ